MIFRTIKKIVILVVLHIYSVSVYSQYQDFRFTHLTTDNGLSQSNVICILQDSKGFMWFGTFNGLNRYNGYDFEIFQHRLNDPKSISHNFISTLFEDRNGRLWIGTSDGLNYYNRLTNSFKSYIHQENNPESISDNQIETIFEDSKGRLWIGTRNGGLELFDPESESFIHHFHDENDKKSLSSNFIRVLFEDNDGNLWIAHWNGAIDIFNENHNEFEQLSIHGEKLTDFPITAIVESSDKNIWIGTQGDGLYRIKYENGNTRLIAHYSNPSPNNNGISSKIVLALIYGRQNKLWIGTEDNGINILDIETNTFKYCKHDPFNQSSLNYDSIWSIYEDRAGNIWIGTYAGGINLLTKGKSYFQHYKHLPGNDNSLSANRVNSFVEDKNNNLWIATDGGGLNLFERRNKRFVHYNSKNSNIGTDAIVCLFEDSYGRFWVGTWGAGLYQFDRKTEEFTQYTKEKHGLGGDNILDICEDRDGGLWLCTFWGGLTYFNIDDQSVVVYNSENSGLSDNDARVVIEDVEGDLWIGTDLGLDFFNPQTKTFVNYKHDDQDENSLSKGFVNSIIQTGDSTIWIGTTGGLNKFNRKAHTFVHYNTNNGLPNDDIKCIIEDAGSILWLSTDKGISRFDLKSETFKNYDFSDGLQGNEFNACSGCKTARGEIIFGGNNGFNIFQPDNLKDNTYIPPVVITNFKIFNKPVSIGGEDSPLQKHISETQKLTLSYRDAVFSFEFVALNYISPEKNQYAYMMEGFESNWNYVGSTRTATYTNLDPGQYKFRVKASNNDGIWNEQGAFIDITIEPPFWKTWWAYLIESLLVIAIVYFVLNYFISRQRLRNALKIEHLELEKMYELDQMKTQFFTNISHEFHSPLTLILSPLEKLITSQITDDKIKNSLVLVHRNAQRLQRMTNQLKDFQKIETDGLQLRLSRGNIIHFIKEVVHSFQDYAIDHHIHFQFKAEQDYAIAWFDPDKLDKIVYNLLSNAFRFTPDEGEVTVTVSIISSEMIAKFNQRKDKAARYIEISVQDSGVGIPDDKIEHIFQRFYHIEDYHDHHYEGSGVGLAFVYELIKLYQGEISVSSTEGQGTKFTVQIPIDEHYLEENQLVGRFDVAPIDISTSQDLPVADFKKFADAKSAKQETQVKDTSVILIIEDDKEIRDYIRNSLGSKYRIFCAENGLEGFKRAVKIIPDLIISDIKMPEIGGIQLCNQLKEDEKTSHIPIVLLTAYSSREYKIEGLSKGVDAYLTKPFNIDVLEAHIVNLLESRRKLRDKFIREILLGPKKVAITDIDEKFLQRVMETIEKHISDNKFNAEILSKKVGMSRMQLYRKLRGLTDQTVHEFIRSIRLKRAVQLLEEKRMTITEVAYEVGFNDLTYFARCFRKQYNKSPSEYISNKK